MIICFEGPSAIGKSSLCQLLSNEYIIVPEVNLLFQGQQPNTKFWYYEKQIERYQMCSNEKNSSILDGDPFQPLWYNWIYGYPTNFPSFEETIEFYSQKITSNQVRFPDLYIIFETSLENLHKRKEQDKTRTRRNFKKHLKFIEPQKRYFDFLQKETSLKVKYVNLSDLETIKEELVELFQSTKVKEQNTVDSFMNIKYWLSKQR